jgi:hypothetical protein
MSEFETIVDERLNCTAVTTFAPVTDRARETNHVNVFEYKGLK